MILIMAFYLLLRTYVCCVPGLSSSITAGYYTARQNTAQIHHIVTGDSAPVRSFAL